MQKVMLICREQDGNPDWPPIGAVGYVVRGVDEYGDYEIMFDDYPWIGNDDPTWEIPKGWFVPIMEEKTKELSGNVVINIICDEV